MRDPSGERREHPIRVAAGRFHLDDVRAKIGEESRHVGRGNVPEFDDSKMTESSGFRSNVFVCHKR
jgi:hypothetical protein